MTYERSRFNLARGSRFKLDESLKSGSSSATSAVLSIRSGRDCKLAHRCVDWHPQLRHPSSTWPHQSQRRDPCPDVPSPHTMPCASGSLFGRCSQPSEANAFQIGREYWKGSTGSGTYRDCSQDFRRSCINKARGTAIHETVPSISTRDHEISVTFYDGAAFHGFTS